MVTSAGQPAGARLYRNLSRLSSSVTARPRLMIKASLGECPGAPRLQRRDSPHLPSPKPQVTGLWEVARSAPIAAKRFRPLSPRSWLVRMTGFTMTAIGPATEPRCPEGSWPSRSLPVVSSDLGARLRLRTCVRLGLRTCARPGLPTCVSGVLLPSVRIPRPALLHRAAYVRLD